MTSFIIVAAAFALLAAAAVAVPLFRDAGGRWTGVVAALAMLGASAGLYTAWSNFDWRVAPEAPRPQVSADVLAMVSRLEGRLREQPNDEKGWSMLGRSYVAMERYEDAVVAFGKAHDLDANDVEATLGLGEALSLRGGGEISPQSAQLFEQAVRQAPDNPKALLYAGFAAAVTGDEAKARERWLKLKAMHPPEAIDKMLDARLAELSPSPGDPAADAGGQAQPAGEATVTLRIAPALKARLTGDAPIFVFARAPGAGGPPLAAKRLNAAAIGTEVHLTSADSMVPGRTLRRGQTVSITARVSFSGQPLPAAGDLYGEVSYDVGRDGVRELVIDRVAQ